MLSSSFGDAVASAAAAFSDGADADPLDSLSDNEDLNEEDFLAYALAQLRATTTPAMAFNIVVLAQLRDNFILDLPFIKYRFFGSARDSYPGKVMVHCTNPAVTMLIFTRKILVVGAKTQSAAQVAVTTVVNRIQRCYIRDGRTELPQVGAITVANMQTVFYIGHSINVIRLRDCLPQCTFNPDLIRILYQKFPVPVDPVHYKDYELLDALAKLVQQPAVAEKAKRIDVAPEENVFCGVKCQIINANIGRHGKIVLTGLQDWWQAMPAMEVMLRILAPHIHYVQVLRVADGPRRAPGLKRVRQRSSRVRITKRKKP